MIDSTNDHGKGLFDPSKLSSRFQCAHFRLKISKNIFFNIHGFTKFVHNRMKELVTLWVLHMLAIDRHKEVGNVVSFIY